MKRLEIPPLAISFIWNYADRNFVDKVLETVRSDFARDVERPFSRGLNIPLFYYSTLNPSETPKNKPKIIAQKNIVFIFISENTIGQEKWKIYINSLDARLILVPIAISHLGLSQTNSGILKDKNCIRAFDWPADNVKQYTSLFIGHEIYRFGFKGTENINKGKESSIKIFLSHTKKGEIGKEYAKKIYQFIDTTNMNRFFDSSDITPSFNFDNEITQHINESTLIAIITDEYSSRYWCQREILHAKKVKRPIIAVNCLNEYEDRIFPASANIPCIHINSDSAIIEKDILRILVATILETVRHEYAYTILNYYKDAGWFYKLSTIIPRPPEIAEVIALHKNRKKNVCYPEPPLYIEEAEWLSHFNVNAFTPLWNTEESKIFDNKKIGISISDTGNLDYSSHHLHENHLIRLSQDVSRHILARAGTVLYGGDLRQNGFTEFILEEAVALKNRLKTDKIFVENHLAWPLYVSGEDIIRWRATYIDVMDTIPHEVPQDVIKMVDVKTFIKPIDSNNKYIWSRCLTEMRKGSIKKSHARICAGGKLFGYSGKMPGVLEEILIALETEKPLYLLGAFGGVVEEVCKTVRTGKITEALTEEWQSFHNEGYFDLQEKAKKHGHNANYEKVKVALESCKVEVLASRAGISTEEYKRIMESPFTDECVYLILKGMKKLWTQSSKVC